MLRRLWIAALVLIAGVAVTTAGASIQGAASAQPASVGKCPDRLESGTHALTCDCSPDAVSSGASIWGADVYTDDSPICLAARHAGLIDASGGVVDVHEAPGQSSYPSETRNGITSGSWASYPRSITFGSEQVYAQFEACPDRLDGQVRSLTCECSPGAASSGGTVWGSDVYTDDSSICRAAVHAGMIGPEGGPVDVLEARGRASYPAVSRNGVRSESWGSYPRSITFRSRGTL